MKKNLKVNEVIPEDKRYVVCLNPEEAECNKTVREHEVEQIETTIAMDGIKQLIGNSPTIVSGGQPPAGYQAIQCGNE